MRVLLVAALLALAGSPVAAQDLELELTEASLNRLVARLGDPSASGIFQPSGPLGSLGYSGCTAAGTMPCATGLSSRAGASTGVTAEAAKPGAATTARAATNVTGSTAVVVTPGVPTGLDAAPASGGFSLSVSLCIGPDGQPVVVPGVVPVVWQWWITKARFTVQAQQLTFTANVRYRVGRQWFSDERTVPATLSFDSASHRLQMQIASFKVPISYSAYGVSEALTEVDVGRHMSFAIPISLQSFQVTDPQGRAINLVGRAQTANVEYQPGKVQVKAYVGFY